MTEEAPTISPSDPRVIIAGIRQFGLAHDGSDLQMLEAALDRLSTPPSVSAREIADEIVAKFLDRPQDEDPGVTGSWLLDAIASAIAAARDPAQCGKLWARAEKAEEQIREQEREIERLRRAEHIDRASTKIVGEIAAMIPLPQTLDKTKTAGDFIDYVKGRLKAAETAEAQRDKAVSALKAILVQSNGPNCAAVAHEALSEIETKEAAE